MFFSPMRTPTPSFDHRELFRAVPGISSPDPRGLRRLAVVLGIVLLVATEIAGQESQEPPITAADRQHWAFRPLRRVEPPIVAGLQSPIDRFLVARLNEEGIEQPLPEADRWTLIRRVTFDLTGLPPTPS